MKETVNLTTLIAVWDKLHVKDAGEIGFCDLDNALSECGVLVVDDTPGGCSQHKEAR